MPNWIAIPKAIRRHPRTTGLFSLALFILVLNPAASFAQIRLASRFGQANVGSQRVIVHVTVVVPPGSDANTVAEDALRGQGARPIEPADFTLTGLVWDQFYNADNTDDHVVQNYNSFGSPVSAETSLNNSENTWSAVPTSRFAFFYGGTTNRCPSLVKECPGRQTFDGYNDVGWINLSGCCTLAVTWSGTSIDEADMALNSRFSWTTTKGGAGYDVETVMLHENGHVVGLGHSSVSGSVMQAAYSGEQRTLGEDDERGATYLYPEPGRVGNISGTVTTTEGVPIAGASVQIVDFPVFAATDPFGHYVIEGVPEIGIYSISASARRYEAETVNNIVVPDSNVNFQLDRKGR